MFTFRFAQFIFISRVFIFERRAFILRGHAFYLIAREYQCFSVLVVHLLGIELTMDKFGAVQVGQRLWTLEGIQHLSIDINEMEFLELYTRSWNNLTPGHINHRSSMRYPSIIPLFNHKPR